MGWDYRLSPEIDLFIKDRIMETDANRQKRTAALILERLSNCPGQILADEVGMGKTYVALAVAVSVALQDTRKRPVVVMIPPGLKEKWPNELAKFNDKCLPSAISSKVKSAIATNPIEFLQLLYAPKLSRPNLLFLTHTALSRSLTSGWVQLAIIQRALYRRHDPNGLIKKLLSRVIPDVLNLNCKSENGNDWIDLLLSNTPAKWRNVLRDCKMHGDIPDLLIPQKIVDTLYDSKAMPSKCFDELFKSIQEVFGKNSGGKKRRIDKFKTSIHGKIKAVWNSCLRLIEHSGTCPLLILDEAHHVKNKSTRLSQHFSKDLDSEDQSVGGQLYRLFDRMLFLTATPFELGHRELCNILERFGGVNWKSFGDYSAGLNDEYVHEIKGLREQLDATQAAGMLFDEAWSMLTFEDILGEGNSDGGTEKWWNVLLENHGNVNGQDSRFLSLVERYEQLKRQMNESEKRLKKFIIRNLRSKMLGGDYVDIPRRRLLPGAGIVNDDCSNGEGLPVEKESLLPFLLASRLSSLAPDNRPVFAEGLASSYQAFLETRATKWNSDLVDTDEDDRLDRPETDRRAEMYLSEMENYLSGRRKSLEHPKVNATVRKVMELWERGEKVLVFCNYLATTRALQIAVSDEMRNWILTRAAQKLKCEKAGVNAKLKSIGDQFDQKRLGRRVMEEWLLDVLKDYPSLAHYEEEILRVVIRYFRTPGFLVRYFPLGEKGKMDRLLERALGQKDSSNLPLNQVIRNFLKFLAEQCGETERKNYLNALESLFSGETKLRRLRNKVAELDEEEHNVLPNVGKVDGRNKNDDRRHKMMLTFNTPFYPDVLIASNVMAEGVDLHLNCRHVIHHDLSWNPSILEQRTGRVDRIGAKAEHCGQPIHVYHPYIAATQDEKMYKTVMERGRWFSILMSASYEVDWFSAEKNATRIPLPDAIVDELVFKLGV